MARTVPGSGAVIKPVFNSDFGVDYITVLDGGSGYDPENPPRLTVDNCGTPLEEAVLYPIIDESSGKIVHVRVLERGRGYDPLRVQIIANTETTDIVPSFNPSRILTSISASITSGKFVNKDRYRVTTNGLPDPAPYTLTSVYSVPYTHTFIYRGGKEVPSPNLLLETFVEDRTIGIAANGVEIHSPIFTPVLDAETAVNFDYDVVRNPQLVPSDAYGCKSNDVADAGKYFYTSAKLLSAFSATNSVTTINNYFSTGNYQGDKLRHPDGHSKIIGVSYDGYPIYGPYGYTNPSLRGSISRLASSYRYKFGSELDVLRPKITSPANVTFIVRVAQGVTYPGGNRYWVTGNGLNDEEKPNILLDRGVTYTFNQDDASNSTHAILFSPYGTSNAQGWHTPGQIGGDVNAVWSKGVRYFLNGSEVTYSTYRVNFDSATTRRIEITLPVESPDVMYYFCQNHTNMANKILPTGYLNGTFVQDYIYDEEEGDLDQHNGRYCVTPEYPNGTYAYFLSTDSSNNPTYPYVCGPKFYGTPVYPGQSPPALSTESVFAAEATPTIGDNGKIDYISVTKSGDGYFGDARVQIFGGEGSGAFATAVTKAITGLSLINQGRNYLTPPTLFIQGGGGSGAKGSAKIDLTGQVTSITIDNPGQYYQEPPFVLLDGGGGQGAKAVARIAQGQIVGVDIIDPGKDYTFAPSVIFTRLVNLKRRVRNRQSFNSTDFKLTNLLKSLTPSDTTIYVDNTDSFPGSGSLIIGNETVKYSAKSRGRFTGVTRGTNYRYDQRVILDPGQNDPDTGISTYKFEVGDKITRRNDNATNKIAKVYDWNPESRELLVKFEVDDLAFIDGGIPSSEETTIAFSGGVPESSFNNQLPHTIIEAPNKSITLFVGDIASGIKVTPRVILTDSAYEDIAELDGAGNGIPDLINTGTDFENQISLDGGIYNSLYGIEETVGGTNTTLFQIGDSIDDGSLPPKIAQIDYAGALKEGVEHIVTATLTLSNGTGSYFQNEIVTAQSTGIVGTVESWNAVTKQLVLKNIVPYNTGNVNKGINGYYYKFSTKSSIVDVKIINPGLDYTAAPTITFEDTTYGVRATGTAVMTSSGDQIASVNITQRGSDYKQEVIGGVLHPTITVTNAVGDTTGSGAVLEAVLGGEDILGNNGARYRIKSIEYGVIIRNERSESI